MNPRKAKKVWRAAAALTLGLTDTLLNKKKGLGRILVKTPILETVRMSLRPLSLADAEVIYQRWTSDDRVSRYVRWSTHRSAEETREWLTQEVSGLESDKAYQWGFTLKDSGYLFGSGGLVFNEQEGLFELGYNIMHDFWGQGYTTEAAKIIVDFAQGIL